VGETAEVGDAVRVGEAVGVSVAVGDGVGVTVGVDVAVAVGVLVGVGVGSRSSPVSGPVQASRIKPAAMAASHRRTGGLVWLRGMRFLGFPFGDHPVTIVV
jgi:hypothetical protein